MRRWKWGPLLSQLIIIDLFICLAAYLLRPLGAYFTWLFVGTLLLLWWLAVAAVCNLLDLLVNSDER